MPARWAPTTSSAIEANLSTYLSGAGTAESGDERTHRTVVRNGRNESHSRPSVSGETGTYFRLAGGLNTPLMAAKSFSPIAAAASDALLSMT